MKYKNSFFRVVIKENGTYLELFPAVSDGKNLEIKEVFDFLDGKGCADYSMEAIKSAFSSLNDKPVQVKISDIAMPPFDESVNIIVSKDKMVAYMRFYPPSTDGRVMNKREILAELEREKITNGISDRVVDVFLMARQ